MDGRSAREGSDLAQGARAAVVRIADVRYQWSGPQSFGLAIGAFEVAAGERVLLLGPSGSGKSTLLALLAGIAVPDAGRVEILGQDLARLSGPARDRFRAEHIGLIFQLFNLLPYGSALDNVLLPLSFAAKRRARVLAKAEPQTEARRLLGALGLDEERIAGAQASGLSVGQQQRVAAARALIGAPELVIADEPTSALDRDTQAGFLDLLFGEMAASKAALVMVSHDETLGSRFDRVVRLADIARRLPEGVQ